MDVEELRRSLANIPPFDLLSLEVLSVAERHARVRLPGRAHQNATILFGVGEAASTAAFFATYGDHFEGVMTGLRSAEVDYRRPGSGAIVATAQIDEEPSTALEQLASNNRARVRVDVSLTDEADTEVATLIAVWAMRRLP
jgi:hypothetical protein